VLIFDRPPLLRSIAAITCSALMRRMHSMSFTEV
jgi:hypothetical protein